MNLVDPQATPPYRALELVRLEAARHGMHVLDTEVVGLIPQAALAESAAHYLQLRGFDPDAQVIETLLARQGAESRTSPGGTGLGALSLEGFLETLASAAPTPGGGSVAAVSGATGAALIAMVGRLTAGKRGYDDVDARMRQLVVEADSARATLLALADRDASAFDDVMVAYRMPKESDEQKRARTAAIQVALTGAAEVPMEVARRSAQLLPLAQEALEHGNASAASDAMAAVHSLHTAVQIALANVVINVSSLHDAAQRERMHGEADQLRVGAVSSLAHARQAFAGRIAAT